MHKRVAQWSQTSAPCGRVQCRLALPAAQNCYQRISRFNRKRCNVFRARPPPFRVLRIKPASFRRCSRLGIMESRIDELFKHAKSTPPKVNSGGISITIRKNTVANGEAQKNGGGYGLVSSVTECDVSQMRLLSRAQATSSSESDRQLGNGQTTRKLLAYNMHCLFRYEPRLILTFLC